MTHGHLRFHFAYCLEDYTYNDEEGRTAERNNVQKTACENVEEKRETSDKAEEERTHKNNLIEDLLNVKSCRSAGTNAGDRAALLHKVIGNLNRIEGDRDIEVSKRNDKSEEQYYIDKAPEAACGREYLVEEVRALNTCKLHDGKGERDDRARKDDRHNTGHIEFDREIGALTTVLLSANGAFCILDRDSSFCIGHISHEYERTYHDRDNRNPEDDLEPNRDNLTLVDEGTVVDVVEVLSESRECTRQAGYDVGEKDHGDTVADTLFVDSFAEPHNEASACCVARNHNDHREPFSCALGINEEAAGNTGNCFGTENGVVTVRCNERDCDRYVTGDFFDFLLAFFAILSELFKRRERDREKLHNDGRIDIRCYGESK